MKESISLDDLYLFINIVQSGSLTKTSKNLSIPLPTISRRLNRLEKSIGERLLNRNTRNLSLTTFGKMYFNQCIPPLTECMMAVKNLNDNHHQLSGLIKITAPINLTYQWLSKCIFSFMKLYPDINIDLMVTNRIVDLTELGIDIAIRVGELSNSDWIAKKLYTSKNILCASPSYLKSKELPIYPSDLNNHKIIDSNWSNEWSIKNNLTNELYTTVRKPGYLTIDDIDLIISAAKNDLGVCFVPYHFVNSKIKSGQLVHILPEWEGSLRTVHMMFRDRSYIPRRVKVFKEYIEQYVQNEISIK